MKKQNVKKCKSEALLEAIRISNVGDEVIIQNKDKSIWCILKIVCKEHKESR